MPSNSKKPLYLGSSLDDLQKLGAVEIGKKEDPEKYLKIAEKAFMKAEDLWIEGDEEKSFVLFMRYLNSIENAKNTIAYSKSPGRFSVFICKDKVITSLNRGEALKENLRRRYREKREAEEKLKGVEEVEKQLPPVSPPQSQAGPFISPGDLYSLLSARPPTAVILDCRGEKERGRGAVTSLPCVLLPTDRQLLSISLPELRGFLSAVRIELGNVLLVLMDASSEELSTPADSPLVQMRDSLVKFDTAGELKEPPRILDGGYESWRLHYPAHSADRNFSLPVRPTASDDVIFPTIDSPPPPKPSEDFFKPRRAPPPTPPRPSAHPLPDDDVTLPIQSSPDGDVTTETPPLSDPLIPSDPPLSYPSNGTTNHSPPSVPPSAPPLPPNGHNLPPYHPNIYIPTAMLAPRLPYNDTPVYPQSPPSVLPQGTPDLSTSLTSSLPPRAPDHSILSADPTISLPPTRDLSDQLTEEMGRELKEKEQRLRALETEVAEKARLEEKIRTLEEQAGAEQREVLLQKRRMLEEVANEKRQADFELGEKHRQLIEREEVAKLKLREAEESLNMDKARILQAQNLLHEEKKQIEKGKQELEREKQEFEQVKRAVLEQQKVAQQAQAANLSHQFTAEQANTPQMQLNHGLPPGWRKLFDSNTCRFYYQDDKTKTTHWNPPTSWIVSQQPNIMQGKTKGALLSSFQQPAAPTPASEPSLTHVPASGPTPTPKIDRTTKPSPIKTPEVPSRATKSPSLINPYYPQVLARFQAKSKSRMLDPTHGGQGQALTGLKNLGNTCFMNSILQCLVATYPLSEYFITLRFLHHVNPVNPLGMGGEIAEEFAFLVQTLWRGSYKSVAPKDFKMVLSKFAPQFSGSQQHDSQEFLAFLLDGLHEDLNKVLRKEYIPEQDNQGIPDPRAAQISWENHLKRNDSIIVDLFQGQFRSTLTCLKCGFSSVTFEAFMYLSVPIPSAPHVTLVDCVRHFTKAERVAGSNSWFCARCRTHRESAKQLQIWRLPPILLIHLKRFSFVGKWKQKLDTSVNYPLSGLDLSPMTLGPLQPTPYQLFAVSNHSGTLDGGHYTAYVRNAVNNKFYTFDDSVVRDMSPASVMSRNGYMLFYTSVDFTPKLKL